MTAALRTNVKAVLAARGWSVRQAARETGVTYSALAELLNGKRATLAVATIEKFAAATDTTVAALLGEAAPPVASGAASTGGPSSASHVQDIPLDRLDGSPLNPRKTFDDDDLAALAGSIERQGLLENLVVRPRADTPGRFWVVAGERRLRAIRLLADNGATPADRPVPCLVCEGMDDAEHAAVAAVENLQRADLPPLEEGAGFRQLIDDFGWDTARIAAEVGKTRRYVQQRLALVDKLSPACQRALAADEISVSVARALTVAPAAEQDSALDQIATGYWRLLHPDDIRNRLLGDKPRVKDAAFRRDAYNGETVEDGDGAERFVDVAQFEKLQVQAAERRAEKLNTKWAWARLHNENDLGPFRQWEFDEDRENPEAGAVVVIRGNDWRVQSITGLVAREQQQGGSAAPEGTAARPAYSQAALVRAARLKSEAMQAVLLDQPRLALRVATLGLLGSHEIAISRSHMRPEDQHVGSETLLRLQELAAPFVDAKLLSEWRDRSASLDDGLGWKHDKPDAWRVLQALPDDTVGQIFAALVARQLGTFCHGSPRLGDSPLALAIANDLGVDMAARDWCTPEYLKGLRLPALLRIANDCGVTRGGEDERPLDGWTGKKIRERLLELGGELPGGPLAGYVPLDLRFGDPADLEAELAAGGDDNPLEDAA